MAAEAIPAAVAAGVMLLALRVAPAFPDNPSAVVSLRWLARDRFMWLLAGLVFIGVGTYNAVATWLQPILEKFGQGGSAGGLIAVMTFAGIIGAAVLPPMVAARDRRRGMLLALVIGVPSAPLLMLAVVALIGLAVALRLPASVKPPEGA